MIIPRPVQVADKDGEELGSEELEELASERLAPFFLRSPFILAAFQHVSREEAEAWKQIVQSDLTPLWLKG